MRSSRCFTSYARICKFLRLKTLGFSRGGSFCINGGITVFETRFPRASQKPESTAVPRTRWRSDIRNFPPSPPVFASCGPACSQKVSNTVTAAAGSFAPSLYSVYSCKILPLSRTLSRLRFSCSIVSLLCATLSSLDRASGAENKKTAIISIAAIACVAEWVGFEPTHGLPRLTI